VRVATFSEFTVSALKGDSLSGRAAGSAANVAGFTGGGGVAGCDATLGSSGIIFLSAGAPVAATVSERAGCIGMLIVEETAFGATHIELVSGILTVSGATVAG